ncbi:YjbH domain-containing protein [Sulfitobacter sp. 1A16787]|uniref:YjbH domain-containing protein n=1 Tax=Sulfitobacter sp. 1A16787 TaxID=3368571 RepID=UPI0037461795
MRSRPHRNYSKANWRLRQTHCGPNWRYTGTFQVLPRVYGSFRYSIIEGLNGPIVGNRSFDVQFQLVDDSLNRPALALGMRDLLGSRLYSSEYLVTTKCYGLRLELTGGIGWGRLAGRGDLSNPLSALADCVDTRPRRRALNGGQLETDGWFRGPASFFAGVQYQLSDSIRLFAEYISDTYDEERAKTEINNTSPFNFGIEHRLDNGPNLKGFYIGGHGIGAQLSYTINPAQRRVSGGIDTSPLTVGGRKRLAISERGGGKLALEQVLKRGSRMRD